MGPIRGLGHPGPAEAAARWSDKTPLANFVIFKLIWFCRNATGPYGPACARRALRGSIGGSQRMRRMSNLALAIGRRAAPVSAEFVREIVLADLPELEAKPAEGRLKKLRDSHHQVARLLAAGMKAEEISQITGKATSTIYCLKCDPAFKDLIEFYRGRQDASYADLHERLRNLGGTAMALLQERIDEDPDKISNTLLTEVIKTTADRVGHGPKQTNVNINLDLEARLDAARQRAGLIIEASANADGVDEDGSP